ncbi:hypothetical protein DY000_02049481 [Brassica cretica]|uniref:Uncharacterized protein n=1 Tax=Brassica cretica TaxID=69181 RepID=A0ABQ7F6U1_BRACR|nr:hypothetical protein DY000_02049481 [Brassica cretica]
MHGLMSYRCFRRTRSLRSDRAERTLGCYVATELWLELGRYVATERNGCSVATKRPSGTNAWSLRSYRALARARSLRSDRTSCMCGNCVMTELGSSVLRSSYSDLSVTGLDLDINFVVTVFDPNIGRYVATELGSSSVATWRPILARARSLRTDRAIFFGLFSDVSCFFRMALLNGTIPSDRTDLPSKLLRGVVSCSITGVVWLIDLSVFCETILTALPESTRILEKTVPASSNAMTKASSWGMPSLATSCSWKFIVLTSHIIYSESATSGLLVIVARSRTVCFWRDNLVFGERCIDPSHHGRFSTTSLFPF